LEEASGTRVDSTGNGHDLTAGSGPATNGPGPSGLGNALAVNGSQGRGRADSTGLHFQNSAFTIAAWIFPTAFPASLGMIAGIWQLSRTCAYRLHLNSSGVPFFVVSRDGTSTNLFGVRHAAVLLNRWTFIVGAWDLINHRLLMAEGATPNDPNLFLSPSGVRGPGSIFDGNSPFMVGINFDVGEGFIGRIDGVAMWNRILNNPEVVKLFNNVAGLEYPWNG
jgi:hypothetical protein